MKTFEEFVRRHMALLVGIHVCGLKGEMMEGTFKRGQKILNADEDMLLVMKDMYEFITETKVELPPETMREAVKQAGRNDGVFIGPQKGKEDVDRKRNDAPGSGQSQGAGAQTRAAGPANRSASRDGEQSGGAASPGPPSHGAERPTRRAGQ